MAPGEQFCQLRILLINSIAEPINECAFLSIFTLQSLQMSSMSKTKTRVTRFFVIFRQTRILSNHGIQDWIATVFLPVQPRGQDKGRENDVSSWLFLYPVRSVDRCSSPLFGPCAHRLINHLSLWRMASVLPDLWLLSQSHVIVSHQIMLLSNRDTSLWTTLAT